MPVFADYARYYNLFYRDKDYAGEAAFVLEVLRSRGCEPKTLLDIGCGTGRHAAEMARLGIRATGVDRSDAMLRMGREFLDGLSPAAFSTPLPELLRGDARTVRLGRKFDAAVGLFHVMSYQNTEEDFLAVMRTAKEHLNPGGLFLFDFWHGPGVLRTPPERRERVLEDGNTRVTRIAEPEHRVGDNTVAVKYRVTVTDLATGGSVEMREEHCMRYWFLPEMRYLSGLAGLRPVAAGAWMLDREPDLDDWTAWMAVSA
jgi:SAM-dependent methyltransferase